MVIPIPIETGDRVDRFVVDKPLGLGANSRLFSGMHASLGYAVAIKVLWDESEAEREREIEALCGMAGQAAPSLIHAGKWSEAEDAPWYLVMDLLSGETLARQLQTYRRLDAARLIDLGTQLLQALACLHDVGFAHCDIKPDNVLLSQELGSLGRLSLLDFGSVQRLDGRGVEASELRGTPPYVAPELMRGARPSVASDLYSVAALLYECASGVRPPRSDAGRLPTPLHRIVPIDRELSGLIERAINENPKMRFANARQFAHALRALVIDEAVEVSLEGTMAGTSQETLDTVRLQELSAAVPVEARRSVPWYGDNSILLSTDRPMVWALTGDPGMDQKSVDEALEALSNDFDIVRLDRETCDKKRLEFLYGAPPPSVLMFGDLHVLLSEELLSEMGRQGETSCLLISTHENPELLHSTVNACSLHGQLCLPKSAKDIAAEVTRMAERAGVLRRRYDGLRLALRDAREDLAIVQNTLAASSP